jgi:hypothetical protein
MTNTLTTAQVIRKTVKAGEGVTRIWLDWAEQVATMSQAEYDTFLLAEWNTAEADELATTEHTFDMTWANFRDNYAGRARKIVSLVGIDDDEVIPGLAILAVEEARKSGDCRSWSLQILANFFGRQAKNDGAFVALPAEADEAVTVTAEESEADKLARLQVILASLSADGLVLAAMMVDEQATFVAQQAAPVGDIYAAA